MNHEEALRQAIALVSKNGCSFLQDQREFTLHFIDEPTGFVRVYSKHKCEGFTGVRDYNVSWLLTNREFVKALWPGPSDKSIENLRFGLEHGMRIYPGEVGMTWQHHLQQMVIAEDPIAYLAEHMPGSAS